MKFIRFLLFMFVVANCVIYPVGANHHGVHQEGLHKHHEGNDHQERGLKQVGHPAYREACGACHFAYQPELLPSASWKKILAGRNDHFGESVELDNDSMKLISDYLESNGAETSSAKPAVRIIQSLGDETPIRITDIPYIRKKHYGIPADALKSEAIGGISNCPACHTTADNGLYDDDNVKIPR